MKRYQLMLNKNCNELFNNTLTKAMNKSAPSKYRLTLTITIKITSWSRSTSSTLKPSWPLTNRRRRPTFCHKMATANTTVLTTRVSLDKLLLTTAANQQALLTVNSCHRLVTMIHGQLLGSAWALCSWWLAYLVVSTVRMINTQLTA